MQLLTLIDYHSLLFDSASHCLQRPVRLPGLSLDMQYEGSLSSTALWTAALERQLF
jgi:hypothetical protein